MQKNPVLRFSLVLSLLVVGVASVHALAGSPSRDIIAEIDADDSQTVSITNRLQRVNAILEKANNRYVAIDAVYSPSPEGCFPVLTHVVAPEDQPECWKQLVSLDLAQQQTFQLQSAIAGVDGGTDVYALTRRMARDTATFAQAETLLAGIIGPDLPGIIGPELPGIIGPEIAGIIGPEIAGIIAPEYPPSGIIGPDLPGIIAPEIPGIIGPEKFAALVGIIAPEVPAGIIAPEREATLADLDQQLLQAEKRLLTLAALRQAIATAP